MKKTDFLIIGSGIAGLTFALEVAEAGSVTLITKKEDTDSNTNYAQGGIASVLSMEDSVDLHIADTMKGGAGLCKKRAVTAMAKEGPSRIRDLQKWGVEFSYYYKDGQRVLALGREGGHSRDRIVHKADYTGRAVESTLVSCCEEHPNIEIMEHTTAVDLALDSTGDRIRCTGACVLTPDGEIEMLPARITMLSTGGCGQVYLHTTNPSIATGDGIAAAYRAGARICNLEFMQFHPTALYPVKGQAFLISEAVRGFGGVLRTTDGSEFMKDFHPLKDLAPRDVVARTIDQMLKTRGEDFVYLDITGRRPDEVRERFPSIYRHCLEQNINITKEWIPVVPAAHYMCGGVVTDMYGRTSLSGLYATGEVACSGVHGANRLASNSLLEAVVYSHRAAESAKKEIKELPDPSAIPQVENSIGSSTDEEWVLVSHDKFEVQKLMWDYVGIVRSTLRLDRARRRVELIREEIENLYSRSKLTQGLLELRNIALVASLIIRSALGRKESRGLHYTTDYPKEDNSRKPRNTVFMNRVRRRRTLHPV
ncbi:MAG: L-aspartate oxidase [Candidatus Hatepunaea meridiana]|nr:L-aspartate oxidase [Candidatus Hatepunaea meridiana]